MGLPCILNIVEGGPQYPDGFGQNGTVVFYNDLTIPFLYLRKFRNYGYIIPDHCFQSLLTVHFIVQDAPYIDKEEGNNDPQKSTGHIVHHLIGGDRGGTGAIGPVHYGGGWGCRGEGNLSFLPFFQ